MSSASSEFYQNGLREGLFFLREPNVRLNLLPDGEIDLQNTGCHLHDCAEINVFLKGRCTLRVGARQRQTFEAGDLCIIPPYCAHVAEPEDGAEFLAMINEPKSISLYAPCGQRGRLSFMHAPMVIIGETLDLNRYLCDAISLMEESPSQKEPARQLLDFYLMRLQHLINQPARHVSRDRHVEHPKVQECLKFVEANLAYRDLSVHMIAAHLDLNPDYLSTLFKAEMGTGLVQHIRNERVVNAKKLITQSQLTIKEIAWNCGFSDASYFTKIFKQQTGTTPKRFAQKAE